MTDLTPRQVFWIKRIADGNGAAASSNVTLRGLARRGIVRMIWKEHPHPLTGKYAFWVLTDKGKQLVDEAKALAAAVRIEAAE